MIKISNDINHQGENTPAHIAKPLRVRERLTSSAAGIDSRTLDPLSAQDQTMATGSLASRKKKALFSSSQLEKNPKEERTQMAQRRSHIYPGGPRYIL